MNGLGADDDLPVALTVRGSGAGPDADALAAAYRHEGTLAKAALQQCQKELAKTQQEKARLSARLAATQLPTTTTHVVAPATGMPVVLTSQANAAQAQLQAQRLAAQAQALRASLAARQAAGQALPTLTLTGGVPSWLTRLFGGKK